MTLGRTSTGAIKIKTDGGLRAVNCACCGSCGECYITIPQALRELAANATAESFSINGENPEPQDFIRYSETSWATVASSYDAVYIDGCFQFIIYAPALPGIAETGNPEKCAFPLGSSTVTGNFTINTITGFDYFSYTDGGQTPVPPPIVVFT
jgi:hypothetical protein